MNDLMTIPGMYGGVNVPHWDQYAGDWAMPIDRFDELASRFRAMDPAAHVAEFRAARQEDDDLLRPHYEVLEGGIAVTDLRGMMTKYGSSLSPLPGGTLGLQRTLRAAYADPSVLGMVLRIDSPGGNVAGTGALARDVRKISETKPIVAFIEDIGASGAYWVGSQAAQLVAGEEAYVGSIGVYAIVDDWSALFAKEGVKRHVIRAGAFKGAGTQGTEITAEQLAEFQRHINEVNGLFVKAVAGGRRMEFEQAMQLSDGRIHLAAQAKKLGLIDAVGSFEQAVKTAKRLSGDRSQGRSKAAHLGEDVESDSGNGASEARGDVLPRPRGDNQSGDVEMANTETTSPAVKPQAATVQELKRALPDASAEFRESCQEMGATVQEAKDLWMDELRTKAKAQEATIAELKAAQAKISEEAKAASKRTGVEAPGFSVGTQGGGGAGGDARAEWDAKIAEKVQAGMEPTLAARKVNRENPGLRERMLAEHNGAHPREKRAA